MAGAALRAAAASRRERDELAQRIAGEVYATCVAIKSDLATEPGSPLGRYPMWMLGPLQYVAQGAAEVAGQAHRVTGDEMPDLAAYFFALLVADVEGMVGSFDREHFDRWVKRRDGEGE